MFHLNRCIKKLKVFHLKVNLFLWNWKSHKLEFECWMTEDGLGLYLIQYCQTMLDPWKCNSRYISHWFNFDYLWLTSGEEEQSSTEFLSKWQSGHLLPPTISCSTSVNVREEAAPQKQIHRREEKTIFRTVVREDQPRLRPLTLAPVLVTNQVTGKHLKVCEYFFFSTWPWNCDIAKQTSDLAV